MPRVEFDVTGIPIPQGSKTGIWHDRAQKVVVIEGRNKDARDAHALWRADVQSEALHHRFALRGHERAPLKVTLQFRLPRIKSRPAGEVWSSTKPDLDKLARAVHDGLEEGLVIANDSRIAVSATSKRFVRNGEKPGVHVVIETLDHDHEAVA